MFHLIPSLSFIIFVFQPKDLLTHLPSIRYDKNTQRKD